MAATLNAQLIDAVETGQDEDVRRLIESGASADARKRVILKAKVKDVGEDGRVEWKEDAVDGESALTLAILRGWVGVLRVLLENGACVDGTVEWRIGHYISGHDWTVQEWEKRWFLTYRFPSALTLAMGRGGTWTHVDGFVKKSAGSDGKVAINVPGGEVVLRHPETWQDVLVDFTPPEPNVEIVRLLLAYGATVCH